MTPSVSESWTRIEKWLADHAPAAHAALAPPADSADIAAVERVIGGPLPRALVASLRRHDGLRGHGFTLIPGFYAPMGARGIADEWRRLQGFYDVSTEEEDDAADDFMKTGFSSALYGHPRLIPIARDGTGGHLVLDHRPEPDRGRVHVVEPVEGLLRVPHEKWSSLPALMEAIAGSLETGRPLNGHTPGVNEERMLHWDFGPAAR
ncbi:SMI1/KNR4 family protein [Streptomyces sp. NPDC002467]|uniref:SMI1/KNR4 family protein n=1 Tax=Streptomyces sp. NPDC002467 TaxID=3364647 RepID=UPI0036CAF565